MPWAFWSIRPVDFSTVSSPPTSGESVADAQGIRPKNSGEMFVDTTGLSWWLVADEFFIDYIELIMDISHYLYIYI